MPSINMIAGRRAEKRRQEQNTRKLALGVLAEVGIVALAIGAMSVRLVGMHGHVSDLDAQLRKLQPEVTQIQQLEQETTKLTPKVATLDGARADTLFWYNNLYAVTSSLPPKSWLTALNTSGGAAAAPGAAAGSDPSLNLSGIALNQATVGETMLRMNQAPGLDHIDLSYVQQQKIGQTDTVAFQMTVHLKPEPSPDAQEGTAHVQKS